LFKKERQAFILNRLNLHNKVLNTNLCEDIDVSEDTVLRDLQELADASQPVLAYGGPRNHRIPALHLEVTFLSTFIAAPDSYRPTDLYFKFLKQPKTTL